MKDISCNENVITIDGAIVQLKYIIKQFIEFENAVVVRLEIKARDDDNNNVYGFPLSDKPQQRTHHRNGKLGKVEIFSRLGQAVLTSLYGGGVQYRFLNRYDKTWFVNSELPDLWR